MDLLPLLHEDPGLRLLPQRALGDEGREPFRRLVVRMPRIAGQRVVHRLHHVRHGVQAHDVRGAEGGALCPPDRRPGERVDLVEAQPEGERVVHGGEHREDAHAVGHEVGRVAGAHHALAQGRREEGLEVVDDGRIRGRGRDDLHQAHVARRVEEMDAAEARPDRLRQHLRQFRDREPRGIGGEDRPRREVRRHLVEEGLLPVHALADGLDDEVAFREQPQVLVVVGGRDALDDALRGERAGLELREALERLPDDGVLVAPLGGQVEQHRLHAGVREVGGDLRAHDAGAEDGGLADEEFRHGILLVHARPGRAGYRSGGQALSMPPGIGLGRRSASMAT